MEAEYDNSALVEDSTELINAYVSDALEYRLERAEFAIFDQTYGPKDRNKLDIFWPGKNRNVPMAMFVHGGYWQMLDRPVFSHMAKGLNQRGVAVAVPSYTLCPETSISGIIDELRRACAVLWKTYDRPITVFGHSAGGHLAACMIATKWNRLHKMLPEQLVRSALSISGVFDLAPLIETKRNEVLKLDAEEAKSASPYNWLIEPGQRFDAWVGSEESSEFLRQSKSMAQRWQMMGAATRYEEITGANHFTAIDPLTDPRSPMVERLRELIEPAQEPTLAMLSLPEVEIKPTVLADEEQPDKLPEIKADGDKETDQPSPNAPEATDADRAEAAILPVAEETPDDDEPREEVLVKGAEPRESKSPDTGETEQPQTDLDEGSHGSGAAGALSEPLEQDQPDASTPSVEEHGTIRVVDEQVSSSEKAPVADVPSANDDLTKISGIGGVLTQRLNDLGFTQFSQIAELTESDREMIENVLKFKGRVDREHWITQARHLVAIKELAGLS